MGAQRKSYTPGYRQDAARLVIDTGRPIGVTSWIETVYNRRRRHSSLGQISPVTFEHQLTTAATQAA